METTKLKIVKLLQKVDGFSLLKEDIKDGVFELSSFEQKKEEFLETLEIYFANNSEKGDVVVGSEEMIINVKQSNTEIVIVNNIEKDQKRITIYTDLAYSEIVGFI